MKRIAISVGLLVALASTARAQTSLVCPSTSSNTSFTGSTAQTECSSTITTGCTSKLGVVFDTNTSILRLPGSGGNFQRPPGNTFADNVFYATVGDFDRDGWEDFFAANNNDQLYVMRNQTITCGTTGCSGNATTAPSVQNIPNSWWNTLSNQRDISFRKPYSILGIHNPVKPAVSSGAEDPMAAGDFNGDGWPDVIVISGSVNTRGNPRWPSAARLYLNTQNCRDAQYRPCGAGMLCGLQALNGACSGGSVAGNGVPWNENQLSCTNANDSSCQRYFPTFASYDVRTGAAITALGTFSTGTTLPLPTTSFPGDFGPIGHAAANTGVIDWDGDGDLDLLYGHGSGTCPAGLCQISGRAFFPGIDVWLNDCAQSAQWNAATKSCIGYIPRFSRGTPCTVGNVACNDPQTLIPSTAHNTTTVLPNTNLNFEDHVRGNPAFQYVDIDLDNDYDLVIGAPGCCSTSSNAQYQLRVYKNTSNSRTVQMLDTANPISLSSSNGTYPGFGGSLTGVFVTDFSGDGWPDIMTAGDGVALSLLRSQVRYWKSTGDTAKPYGTNWPGCATNNATCAGCNATCNPMGQALAEPFFYPNSATSAANAEPTITYNSASRCSNNANLHNLNPVGGECSGRNPDGLPTFGDFDTGFMIDYDHDPSYTKDIVLTNGNNSSQFYMFANRATPSIVAPCGTVVSGELPPPTSEATVSGACLTPTASVPSGTSITYYLTNEDPANYQLACRQTGNSTFNPPLTGGQCCVAFTNITGRTITWKAVMDSNTTDGVDVCTATGLQTPTLTSVAANYTYTNVGQHYRAGVIVFDGVTYSGTFTQPGNRGHFYALAAGDGTKYYDTATKLDAQGSRNIYTTNSTATGTRLDFDPTSPSATLQGAIGAATAAEATSTINWVLSPRFGLGASGFAPTKLGAVQNSTPAILAPPFRPKWYGFLTLQEKSLYDQFATTYLGRVPLALFASMDGMLHAIISNAADMGDIRNGTEAWGFIPPAVAKNMKSDYTASTTTNTLTITAYPDGSPGLVDYRKADGSISSVAILAGGDGSKSVSVLDVTDTIDPATFSVSGRGPKPLWSAEPGGSAAGFAKSKPGVVRTQIGGVETTVLVAGSGINGSDANAGKVIAGYNLETGVLLWRYEMMCPLTSDITTFDTDDDGTFEPGSPLLDGFGDRAVFADRCGYLYKINPGQNLAGGWMGNPGFGALALPTANGVARTALFSTQLTPGALVSQRPIVGAIGALADSTTDMVLFFGTGGLESQSVTLANEFYAVYAKSGTIRNKISGTCVSGRCEKFYGGVVVTPDSFIIARSVDPVIGGGSCDFGTSSVQSYGLNSPFAQQFNITSVDGMPISAVTGPMFGDAGALYFATIKGEVKRVGSPRAGAAGADSSAGATQQMGGSTTAYTNAPLTFLGWRNVL